MIIPVEKFNVYFYSLYDARQHEPISGLICAVCLDAAKARIRTSYPDGKYLTVRLVPELAGLYNPQTGYTEINDR